MASSCIVYVSEGQRRLSGIVRAGTLQQDIAARCGVKPPTVCRWLAGTRQPTSAPVLARLVALGIPLDAWDQRPAAGDIAAAPAPTTEAPRPAA